MDKKIAIVGATGVVGREALNILLKNNVKAENILAFSSKRVNINEKIISSAIDLSKLDDVDYAIFCATEEISKQYVTEFAKRGVIVIDNTPAFRGDDNVPLVIPEINFDTIRKADRIIANPNCVMIGTLMAIYPIIQCTGIKKLRVSSYQSVSGAGLANMRELIHQTKHAFSSKPITAEHFPREIIFNLLPAIGSIDKDGFSSEEKKIKEEIQKILHHESIDIAATAVRVPTLIGHGMSICLEVNDNITKDDARELLSQDDNVLYQEDPYKATCADILDEYKTIVSRLRVINGNEILMWAMSNNIKKGAALNAIQIIYKMEDSPLI